MQDLRFAALSDIHGNIWALDAVLTDIRKRNLSTVVNLGDHIYGPLRPLDTAERLMGLGWTSLRGNCDRLLLEAGPASATAVQNRNDLKAVHRNWLSGMPQTLTWNAIFLCHGTPAFDDGCLLEEVAETAVYIRSPEDILADLKGVSERIVLCGHSHQPRTIRLAGERIVVNVGSVGLPAYTDDSPHPHAMEAGSPHARYAIISRKENGWEVDHVEVAYDWHSAAECAARNERLDWAQWLMTGCASSTTSTSS